MVILGMMIGHKMNDKVDLPLIASSPSNSNGNIGRVEEVIRFIESRYVDDLDTKPIVDKAILAAMNELDPHSIYLTKEQMDQVNEEMGGEYRGIGIETFYIDDTVNVILPLKDSPAEKGGIKPFDKIIRINDSLVAGNGLQFKDIRNLLRGPKSSPLKIEVLSKGSDKSQVREVVIEDLPYKSINRFFMAKNNIAYIKIDRFSQKTYEEFMQAIEYLGENKGARHLIIDLRDNPGGVLPDATEILSQLFIQKGNMLVYTQGKNQRKNEYKSTGKPFFNIDKIAVLINENSASGAEILAGAIQDWDRGVIIGRRSFGKGLVQDQYNLSDGSAIRLTVARYYTPSGRSIQKDYTKGNYNADLQDRYDGGEFFEQDSIEYNDSLRFKTKILGRKIFGGGGISPDIFIPMDSIQLYTSFQNIIASIPRFAYSYAMERNLNMPEKAESFINDWNQPVDIEEAFTRYLEETEINGGVLSPEYSKEAFKAIRYQLGRMYYGRNTVDPILIKDDPFIEEAIEFIEGDKMLNDL